MEIDIRNWKTWPWTLILLGLILIFNLTNYIETILLKEQLQSVKIGLLRISSNLDELSSEVELLSDRIDR